MASRAPQSAPTRSESGTGDSRSEYVRSVEEATGRYLASLARERSGEGLHAPAGVARMAQRTLGNAATAELLEPRHAAADRDGAARDHAEAELRDAEEDRDRDEEEDPLLPDPDNPEPADPPAEGDLEDEEEGPDDGPPDHADATPENAGAPPARGASGGSTRSGGGSGGGAPIPGGGASAIAQAAARTAAGMPAAPGTRPGGARPPPSRARRRAPGRRRIAGPPPVPMAEPDFAGIEDPIKSSTEAIEAVAARRLERQVMPPVPPSPGENTVTVPERAISPADLRMIELGEAAMDRAELSREGESPMPGEREGGETRSRLLGIRDELLGVERAEPAPEDAPPAPDPSARSARTPPTAREGAETADAEELAPGSFTVDPIPLPPADMTVAEQEMFTAVIANLKAGGEENANDTLNAIKRDIEEYPGGVLTREEFGLNELGQGLLPELERDMGARVDAVAGILGSAGAMLDDAVRDRRAALERAESERRSATDGDARLELQTIEATAQTRLDDAAAAREHAAEARRRSRAMGSAPDLGFRQVAEAAVRRIQAKVSEAIARFQFEKTERHDALDSARTRWLSAVDLAILKDQFDAERLHNLTPGAPHPPDMPAAARRAVNQAINRGQDWRTAQVTFIDGVIAGLKEETDSAIATNILDVQNAGADAFRALRDWGDTQDGATEQWWQDQVTELDNWADNATDTANTWAETETRLARLELQRAAQYARARIERQLREDEEEFAAYQALTEGERRNFIARNIMNSDVLLRQIGSPMRESLLKANESHVKQVVVEELFALPRGRWQALNSAARAKNSKFDAERSANRIIEAGVNKTGTGESTIFRELSGLRAIERLALTAAYNTFRGSDNALYNDLDSELSGDEWRRAQALMAGRHGEAAAEAIHDAVFGPGTGEPQIYEALETINRLPEPERTEALAQADQVYRDRYGESLSTRLSGDLSGSEERRALALAAGNMREAEAHEMNYALTDRDADAAAAVYERIRTETMEAARSSPTPWTPARFEAEVARRNAELSRNFGEQYGDVGNYGWSRSSTTLENAVVANFWHASDEGTRTRLNGLASGDLVGVSAGHMRAEERSNYADDEVMGDIVVDQHRYAADLVELEQGPELRAGMRRSLALWVRGRENSDDPATAEEIENHRMALERDMNTRMADAAFDRARMNVEALNQGLVDRYGITLDTMIDNTMSDNVFGDGGDLSNARDRLEIMRRDGRDPGAMADRRIDWAYSRIRFGIEGAGTDMDELRGGMSGLTREEMVRLDGRWQIEHGGETLREAIEGDTSGRDEDDLVDLYDNGAPQTVAQQVDELRRKLRRDEESVGFAGAWVSEDHSARSHERLAQLEAMAERMRDPSLTPEQRENLTASFTDQRDSVENAIQAQRDRVDSYAETFTTVLSYAIAAIVIVISAVLTVVSGGTLSPALAGAIALTGSLLGTVAGIAAKAAIKGGAYGMEEVGTDIAVGVVDLAVTAATLGLFKGGSLLANTRAMMSAALEEVTVISRQAITMGLRQAGTQALRVGAAQAGRTIAREAGEEAAESGLRGMAREFALDQMRAVPAVLTANVLNEQNWRHGNVAGNILEGTWEGSLQNLRDAAIMGVASHGVTRAVGRMVHPEPLTPTQTHERNLRHWRHANLDAAPGDYARYVEAYIAANSDYADVVRSAQREARRSLLSEIPPRERGGVADVPIIHVNEAQFRHYNNGNFGDAMVYVQDGQAVIVIRDGAPASSVRRIGPQLRDIVAPGTRGRTVNPVDSLPPRLRNRVPVEVVNDPAFGVDEVRALPLRDAEGNIVGVELQVGPNARAVDIQMHVGTIDSMRRYAGLAGDIRQFLNRAGRGLGMDIADPATAGRWEAELEIAKLPAIIDERIARLAERGMDPRRRALVMEEIANLERQYMRELERAQQGPAAEERGYVAAKAQGDLDTPAAPHETGDGAAAPSPAERAAHVRQLMNDIRAEQTGLSDIEQQIWDAQTPGYTEIQNRVRRQKQSYADALERLSPHLPPNLQAAIRNAGKLWTPTLAEVHARIAGRPEFAQALAKLGKQDRNTINRVGGYLETIDAFHRQRRELETQRTAGEARLAELQQQFRDVGGDSFMGVELHPDLPERRAPPGYQPEYAFERKFRELLGDQLGSELMQAIMDRIELGDADAFNELAARPDVQLAFGNKTIAKVFEQVVAHRQGYRAELALASRIADGIPGLPGNGGHVVLDYGDPIGANQADVISVDADGNVFLWDSKYRSEGAASPHSGTFTDGERRRNAMLDAERILNDPARTAGLSPEALARAKANIAAGNFYAVTSHTNDVFNFTDSPPLRVVNGTIQP